MTMFFPVRCGGAVTATQAPVNWEEGQCSFPSWTGFRSSWCWLSRALWRQDNESESAQELKYTDSVCIMSAPEKGNGIEIINNA